MNFLEELVSEWYEFQGYFVRRNIQVGKRKKGGYDCELDVVAFHPVNKHLVHVEPSMDALAWKRRDERFKKKFRAGRKHIPSLFSGLDLPGEIDQIALLYFASKKNRTEVGGGRLLLVEDYLREIASVLKDRTVSSRAVPEDKPILRTLQFAVQHIDVIQGGIALDDETHE